MVALSLELENSEQDLHLCLVSFPRHNSSCGGIWKGVSVVYRCLQCVNVDRMDRKLVIMLSSHVVFLGMFRNSVSSGSICRLSKSMT
ncbi:hypothetical protein PanWU01x14_086670 [Parasponia andersonii]|uniref:Uncharacterized protein n=1 Tax=Parasponia andersonii TaxID=3476 RepID=A0A2P5D8F2_PARAD|nr:hypothetical protein PanWU01x14_086670 [Parasponia andersonii]